MFSEISKLPAGCSLTFDGSRHPKVQRYWQVARANAQPTGVARRQSLFDLVDGAVQERLQSDVPLGAFLSGGVDSTIVVALMSRHLDHPVHTFSAAFDIGPRSFKYNVDADAADFVAGKLGTDHTRLTIDSSSRLTEVMASAVYQADEPIANPTIISTYLLAEQVKARGVTVVLTGDGSDEIFGGYVRYQRDRWVQWLQSVPKDLRRVLRRALEESGKAGAAREALDKAEFQPADPRRYLGWWTVFSSRERRRILTPEAQAAFDSPNDAVQTAIDGAAGASGGPEMLSYLDAALWIPDESNLRTDKMTMAHALEARAPFQDHALAQFALNLPFNQKVGFPRFHYKQLLRETFADLIPPEISSRQKWGWFSPVHYWVNDHLWAEITELVNYLPGTGLFTPEVKELLNEHPTKIPGKLWSLATFALWHQAFVDNRAGQMVA